MHFGLFVLFQPTPQGRCEDKPGGGKPMCVGMETVIDWSGGSEGRLVSVLKKQPWFVFLSDETGELVRIT